MTKFADLTPEMRERVLEKYRYILVEDTDWWEIVIEDGVCKLEHTGIIVELERSSKSSGQLRPSVYFDLEHNSLVFEASVSEPPDMQAMMALAENKELLYAGSRIIKAFADGRYEGCFISQRQANRPQFYMTHHWDDDHNDLVTELLVEDAIRDAASWLFKCLEREYEHLTSDEAIAEHLEANEYDFDEETGSLGG